MLDTTQYPNKSTESKEIKNRRNQKKPLNMEKLGKYDIPDDVGDVPKTQNSKVFYSNFQFSINILLKMSIRPLNKL